MIKLVIILGTLIPLFFSITPQAFADPKHCYSYDECYNIGYGHGFTDGQSGFSPVDACDNHRHAYCDGYIQGYRDAASSNGNSGIQQGQHSQVNIHGNNNDVRVNQGENVQSGSDGDTGNSYHGANPRCLLICATVR